MTARGVKGVERSWERLWEALARWKPGMTVDEWWEVEDPFFRCLGSVLVQRTTWHNAKKAIEGLKRRGLTNPFAVLQASEEELIAAIRPAGFYRSKVPAIRQLCRFLPEAGKYAGKGSELRDRLLRIRGIGPETADTILLYVFNQPVFIGDAYAERIASRWFGKEYAKDRIREEVPFRFPDPGRLQLFHALLVELGKRFCRKRVPRCPACPLRSTCHSAEEWRNPAD